MELLKRGSRGLAVKIVQKKLNLIEDGIFGVLTEEAVRNFQREHGLVGDGIVGQKTWNALAAEKECESSEEPGTIIRKSTRRIDHIFIHCTASPEGKPMTVSDIRRVHKANGWADIGYHYVVYLDGSVHCGRDVDKVGAHVSGYNSNSIGVAYVGGLENKAGVPTRCQKPKDTRTFAQKEGLRDLVEQLKKLYPQAQVLGHRDISPDKNGNGTVEPFEWIKSCPCFDAKEEYK